MHKWMYQFLVFDAVLTCIVEVLFLPIFIGAQQIPLAAGAAAVINIALTVAAAKISRTALGVWGPTIAWFATAFALVVKGPGGDLMYLANAYTLAFFVAGTLPPAIVAVIQVMKRPKSTAKFGETANV